MDRVGERGDQAAVEAVNPAVDRDFLAAHPGVFEDGGVGDVAGLGEHVEFAEPVHGGLRFEGFQFGAVDPAERADTGQPVVDHAVAEILHGCLHATAAVVAADDDVADFKHIDGVLEDGEDVEVGLGDDVGDVAMDENFPRGEAGDLVGGHAAVGATDPEVFRVLLAGEPAEEPGVRVADGFCPKAVLSQEVFERLHGHFLNRGGELRPSRINPFAPPWRAGPVVATLSPAPRICQRWWRTRRGGDGGRVAC